MKRDPRDVVLPFFARIQEAEYYQGFVKSVEDFIERIKKRAVEKRKEMDMERRRFVFWSLSFSDDELGRQWAMRFLLVLED